MPAGEAIVVGGGLAGLTAAYRLQQAGWKVRVLEANPHVGGRVITIQWRGYSIDPGAEFVSGAETYLLGMVRHLGIQEQLIRYSQEQVGFEVGVMRGGRVYRINFMAPWQFLTWRGVSLPARLSILKLLPYLIRYRRYDLYHPETVPGDDTQTMEQFFYQKISGELFEYWVEPTMDVFCGYTADDLSAKMMLLLFGNYLGTPLYTFVGGLGFFPETLASSLDVQTGARVTRITLAPDQRGVRVYYKQDGQVASLDSDAVVVAVPGDSVLDLLDEPRPAWRAFFPKVRYTRVGIVYHLIEHNDPQLDRGGIMFPRREPWKLSALGWKRQPDGRILAMSDLKASLYDPQMSDQQLRQVITEEVTRAVPAFAGRIVDQMVFRWSHKVPAMPPGYLSALKMFKENPQEGPVYFCGDYLIAGSTGAALASGWQAAERVLRAM
ncbi:MAG: NAD(P)/FAD-dependent oxidoreductase [Anaerolineae bacterium]|nr:FAD-dependent oxidoreductase [Anaerolineae bacterium]MDW8067397.1 NAD(P)/FAD-dependent oxidoreductase [Anaerolineae bacterium]